MNAKLKAATQASLSQIKISGREAWSVLTQAVKRYSEVQASEAAAAVAYYTLFSLFPLLLFLVAIASSVLDNPEIQAQILDSIGELLPTSQELVQNNIEQALRVRGTVGTVGMIGLLWSATAVFSILTQNISEAWNDAQPRNFLKLRLMALTIVGSMVALLIMAQTFSTIVKLFSQLDIPVWGTVPIDETFFRRHVLLWGPRFIIFVAFWLMYWWGPNTRVRWQEAAWGAGTTTVAWELLKTVFAWYIASGFARQQLVYGSLGAVVALMLWIFLSAQIILFGAHISAAIGYKRQRHAETGHQADDST
jgi:membrane protein